MASSGTLKSLRHFTQNIYQIIEIVNNYYITSYINNNNNIGRTYLVSLSYSYNQVAMLVKRLSSNIIENDIPMIATIVYIW